jgi:hypothetical protein
MNQTLNGTTIVETFTLAITNQGYWGLGSQSESWGLPDVEPLAVALANANAVGKTGKIKRGVIVWVSVIIVTDGDLIDDEDMEKARNDRHGLYELPKNAKIGDIWKPRVDIYGSSQYKGLKVAEFTLKG